MNSLEKNIVWLNMFEGLTLRKKEEIIKLYGADCDIRKSFYTRPQLKQIVSKMDYARMENLLDDFSFNRELDEYEKLGVKLVFRHSPEYPKLLLEIDSPPLCLYCKGNIQLLNTKCVAIVGTRRPTEYGMVVTKQYVKELVKHNITIVSGLAQGIDTIAHNEALANYGNTIAVIAGGFNHIYPKSNSALARRMYESNLIICENRPSCLPHAYLFPIRNRIVAGLSEAVLIPEAGVNSGTMHTKNYAIDYGRDLFVVQGKITSPQSQGTNAIIKEFPLSITTEPDDILHALHVDLEEISKNSGVQLDFNAQSVLDYIHSEKKTFQEIADYTGMAVNELNALLFELEMEGLITKLSNNSYIKV